MSSTVAQKVSVPQASIEIPQISGMGCVDPASYRECMTQNRSTASPTTIIWSADDHRHGRSCWWDHIDARWVCRAPVAPTADRPVR